MKLAKKTLSVALAAVMALSSAAVGTTVFAAQDADTATYTALKVGSNTVKTTITAKADETSWDKQVDDNATSSWLTFTPEKTGYYRVSAKTTPIYAGYDATEKDADKRKAIKYDTKSANLVSNTEGKNTAISTDSFDGTTGRVDSFKLEMAGNAKSDKPASGSFDMTIDSTSSWANEKVTYYTAAKFDKSEVVANKDTEAKFYDQSASRTYVFCEAGKTYYLKATMFNAMYAADSPYTGTKKDVKAGDYKVQTQAVAPEATITIAATDWAMDSTGVTTKEVKVEVPTWYNGKYTVKEENGKKYAVVKDIVAEPQTGISYSGLSKTVNVPAKYDGYTVTKFTDCKNLGVTAATIPSSVKKIGEYAFAGTALKSVTFNEGLEEIETGAFANTFLSSVVLPKSLEKIGEDAFAATKITKVTVKNDDLDISDAGFGIFRAENGLNSYTDKTKVQIICNASTKAAYYATLAGFNLTNDCKGNHSYVVVKKATIFAAGQQKCSKCGAVATIAKVKFAPTAKASKKNIVVKGNAGKVNKLAVWVYDSKGKLVKKQVKKNVTKNTVKVSKAGKYTVKVKAYGPNGAKTSSVKKTVKVK